MTLFGLPLSALSSSVLLGCFFVFLVFFGFVVCESVVCAPASFELDSARASEDPATDRAKAAMNERIRFEDTGRLLEGLRRGTFDPVDPMLGYYQRFMCFWYGIGEPLRRGTIHARRTGTDEHFSIDSRIGRGAQRDCASPTAWSFLERERQPRARTLLFV